MKSKIWIGYSGGVDSHVLLHIVSKHYLSVHAVHINHGLSPNARAWQQHCIQVCAALNIPLSCITVNAKAQRGQSPEAAARDARYAAWQKLIAPEDVLLTAHHANDQAETILYRLLRGTGPQGLAGIVAKTVVNGITILRPMLDLTKHEILQYAHEHNLQWINDESNANTDFDRNFIRQNIMPLLEPRWTAVRNINRAGQLCRELTLNLATPEILDLDFWQRQTLYAWLKQHKVQASAQHIDTIIKELINAQADAQPELAIGDKMVKRSQHKLYILDKSAKLPQATRQHGRKAKKVFQQHGIPPWERDAYDLVFDGGRLLEIVGLWRNPRSATVQSRI